MNDLRNRGLAVLNDTSPAAERTIIVLGVARSGTSMVAKALRRLGVFMGDNADEITVEDMGMAHALEREPHLLPATIAGYNGRHPVWGFKRPDAYRSIGPHLSLFRNPRLIVTFRDPLAIAMRNSISLRWDALSALGHAKGELDGLIAFIRSVDVPTLLVSYEKALADPDGFVGTLSAFCGIDAAAAGKHAAVASMENGPVAYLKAAAPA